MLCGVLGSLFDSQNYVGNEYLRCGFSNKIRRKWKRTFNATELLNIFDSAKYFDKKVDSQVVKFQIKRQFIPFK